jgi:hypothetical protein
MIEAFTRVWTLSKNGSMKSGSVSPSSIEGLEAAASRIQAFGLGAGGY